MLYYCHNCDIELDDDEVEDDLCPVCGDELPEPSEEVE